MPVETQKLYIVSDNKFVFSNCGEYIALWARKICWNKCTLNMILISSGSSRCFFLLKIFISYFYFLVFFCFNNIFNQKKLGIWSDTLSIIFPLSIFLSIVLIKMLLIILGLLLATILVGSRIQGWRKLEYIRFKNSLKIVFFTFENIVIDCQYFF